MFYNRECRKRLRKERFLKILGLPSTGSILDISCGDGDLLGEIYKLNPNIKLNGVDISAESLEEAKNKYPNISFNVGNADSLPYLDGSFDVVTCTTSLHHYENPQLALKEMRRLLAANGTIYLLDLFPRNKISQFIYNFRGCSEPYHFEKFYTVKEINQLLTSAGLKIKNVKRLIPFPRFVAIELTK